MVQYTFTDEFDGPKGSLPDAAKWLWDVGPGPVVGGNNEREDYVKSPENTYLDGEGHLVIEVTSPEEGVFYSGRLKSNFHQQYGHWEASIAIKDTPGCWPAFWFLGTANFGRHPECGEVDLLENYGTGYSDGSVWNTFATYNKHGRSLDKTDEEFHAYRMDWAENSITLSIDDVEFVSVDRQDLDSWPFDGNELYCLLNIAVGGNGTGNVLPYREAFPVRMLVDYVHCWE
jgi:beta-glucanase (GH16 family)